MGRARGKLWIPSQTSKDQGEPDLSLPFSLRQAAMAYLRWHCM